MKVSQPRDLSKDPKAFPEFTPDVVSDLRTSLELSLDDMLDSDSADFRQFLLTDDMYFNGRLAKLYGTKLPDDSPFQKVDFEPDHRAGVLTHPYLMAASPTHDKLADPPRRLPGARRAGRVAAAAGGSSHAAAARCSRRPDHPRARRPANSAGTCRAAMA